MISHQDEGQADGQDNAQNDLPASASPHAAADGTHSPAENCDAGVSRRSLLQASATLLTGANAVSLALPDAAEAGAGAGGVTVTATVAVYLAKLMKANGCGAMFGVPGATCDPLFEAADREQMSVVVTSSDLEAGYAADGYARRKGLGFVSVTYGVGTLSLVNAIAGTYAERSPVVVINGGANAADLASQRADGVAFSHSIGRNTDGISIHTDLAIFQQVTEWAERITDATMVPARARAALQTALRTRRPIYIEISKAIWNSRTTGRIDPVAGAPPASGSETDVATAIVSAMRTARRPVLMLGIEIQRYGLADAATALVRRLGLPWTTTLLAKSVVSESTPGFVGVYDGSSAPPATRSVVDGSDLLVTIGCAFGRQYRDLIAAKKSAPSKLIEVNRGRATIKGAAPRTAALGPLLAALNTVPFSAPANWVARPGLAGLTFDARRQSMAAVSGGADPQSAAAGAGALSIDDVMRVVDGVLDASTVTLVDTSLSMYPAADLNIRARDGFICNAVWQSIGYTVGAAVGVAIAEPDKRVLVICGDGGFQMTAQALSTLARRNVRATVLVLDNGSYAIEQYVVEKSKGIEPNSSQSYFKSTTVPLIPHLALNGWDYAALARALGFRAAETVATTANLQRALAAAATLNGPSLIAVKVLKRSLPSELWPS